MFEGPIKLIEKSKNILLLSHKEPDGDALGSLLALSSALSKLDRRVRPISSGKIATNFLFMPGLEMLDREISKENDLIIILDLADLSRSDFADEIKLMLRNIPSILVDHHPKGDLYNFCTYKIHNPNASSTAEILYFLINNLGVRIDREVATNLLTGILADTTGFQTSNTTIETLKVASSLLAAGARIERIVEHIFYHKPSNILRLWGRAMMRLRRNNQYNILVTFLTKNDFLECEVGEEAASGIVNFININSFPSACAVLLLVEKNSKIKGSLRTQKNEIDVSRLAKIFGGGGHKKAAGFEIEGRLVFKNGEVRVE